MTSRLSRSHAKPPYDARHMTQTRHLIAVAGILAAVFAMPAGATAAPPTSSADPADQVVVRFRATTTSDERAALLRDLSLSVIHRGRTGRNQVVVAVGRSVATVKRALRNDPRVEAVAPNVQRELTYDPASEPEFPQEWGLHNVGQTIDLGPPAGPVTGVPGVDVGGLEALGVSTGLTEIVVAVIDDGIDFTHPDLVDRAWTDPNQPGSTVHGRDFCHADDDPKPAAGDWHGTHVAGTIAASLNGTGVVGVAPSVRLMALKAFEHSGSCDGGILGGSDALLADAIDFAASLHVPIINASWGGDGSSTVLDAAIAESGALFVAAGGNQGRDLDAPGVDFYPAESVNANVISVAAIDQRGGLANFSNFGQQSVDVSAPGVNILSTVPGGYGWAAGTSMAAPHVSGVAALLASQDPSLTATALKARILARGKPLAGTSCRSVTGRLVNAYRTIVGDSSLALPPCSYRFDNAQVIGSSIRIVVGWPSGTVGPNGISSYVVRRRIGTGGWATLISSTVSRTVRTPITFATATNYGIRARDNLGVVSDQADGPGVIAKLFQDTSSQATYAGSWSSVSTSTASGGRLHTSTRAGASVTFRTSGRAMAVVGRLGPANGQAKVYVDGVYVRTVDFHRTTTRSRVVVFQRSWAASGSHTIKVVVVGTAGHPKVEIDAFPVLR